MPYGREHMKLLRLFDVANMCAGEVDAWMVLHFGIKEIEGLNGKDAEIACNILRGQINRAKKKGRVTGRKPGRPKKKKEVGA